MPLCRDPSHQLPKRFPMRKSPGWLSSRRADQYRNHLLIDTTLTFWKPINNPNHAKSEQAFVFYPSSLFQLYIIVVTVDLVFIKAIIVVGIIRRDTLRVQRSSFKNQILKKVCEIWNMKVPLAKGLEPDFIVGSVVLCSLRVERL